uniref:Uncharacterized protein n=1 Tax=Romanomermis culicivorax TaxID=13658 RepID=A0A915HLA6_ROMCU
MTNYDRISEKFSPPTKRHNNDRNDKFYSEIDEPCSTSHLRSAADQQNRHCSSSSSIENRHHESQKFLDSIDEPKYHYEADFDFRALKKISAMKNTILNIGRSGRKMNNYGNNFCTKGTIEDSGYQSVLERSQCSQYGTGWLMVDNESLGSNNSADEWDGFMLVNDEKVKIKDMSDLLAARFAFISGAKTTDGLPILTFPDSKIHLPFPDYRRLVGYLIQVPP